MGVFALLLLIPCLSFAGKDFERIVVFGDSLSDPGNVFAITGNSLKPPYSSLDEFLIPDAPYARGGHHFSNGATWVERFAKKLDLGDSVGPAFKVEDEDELKRSNYAVGGARARDDGENINLTAQIGAFFADTRGVALEESFYVMALGGNDVRDAVEALALDDTGIASAEILARALSSISDSLIALYSAGARTVMVANAPDISLTPAIQKFDQVSPGAALGAALLVSQFNSELEGLLTLLEQSSPGLEIIRLDLFQGIREIVADPAAYGLNNVQDACVMPNQKPSACKKPKRYLFWDGIHPTKKTHRVIARKARQAFNVFFKEDSGEACPYGGKSRSAQCKPRLWL